MNKKQAIMKKVIAIILLLIYIFYFNNSSIFAAINSNYENSLVFDYQEDTAGNALLSVIAKVVLPLIFPIFTTIEGIVAKVMHMITNQYFFPWADMIIYNAVPLLDINFINPSEGSFFMDINGQETSIGKIVRNTYFTVLSICIGFLGLCVAINAIKLMISSMANQKAKYKQAINSTVMTLILLFGLHYIISFCFFINEQMVIIASNVTQKIISPEDIIAAGDIMNATDYEESKKLVENFVDYADHTSPSPITIAKKTVKEIVNGVQSICDRIGNAVKNTWEAIKDFFGWGDDDKEEEMDGDDVRKLYEDIFPSKADIIDYLSDGSDCNKTGDHRDYHVGKEGVNIAAYLIKDKSFRDAYLWSVAGNDTNKFSESGLKGWLTSATNTVLWTSGIVDTGLLGLENLYEAVHYISIEMKNDNNGKGFLTSAKQYETLNSQLLEVINDPTKDEKERNTARISSLYLNAYYKYIYDGEDKKDTSVKSIISNLGNYFKSKAYYTDLDGGDWSPTTFDVVPTLLYCIFLVQSIMYLFSYIKRFFFVIIMSLLGPVTVVFDYVKKSY